MISAAAFLCIFVALAVAAFVRHPIFGLYLYLGVFYVHPPSRWWYDSLPDVRWALAAAVIAILSVLIHRRAESDTRGSWLRTIPGLVLLLYVIWMWVQSAWALDTSIHIDATTQMTKYLVAFYLIWRLADTPERIRDVLLVHVAGCFYLGWVAFQAGLIGGSRLDGVGGPGIDDANSLSMFLGTGVVVGAVLLLQVDGWRRWFCVAAMPFMLNGMVLGGSRGAFLGLVAGGCVLFFLHPREKRWLFWIYAVIGLGLMAHLSDSRFIERVLSVRGAVEDPTEMDASMQGRIVVIQAQWQMFQAYPHGSGHRGTAALSGLYLDAQWLTRRHENEPLARSSHNTFMTALTEQGVPGALLYLWLSLWGVFAILRLKRAEQQGVPFSLRAPAIGSCAAIAVIWASGQFTDYLMTEVLIWQLALLASALALMRARPAITTEPAQSLAPVHER